MSAMTLRIITGGRKDPPKHRLPRKARAMMRVFDGDGRAAYLSAIMTTPRLHGCDL